MHRPLAKRFQHTIRGARKHLTIATAVLRRGGGVGVVIHARVRTIQQAMRTGHIVAPTRLTTPSAIGGPKPRARWVGIAGGAAVAVSRVTVRDADVVRGVPRAEFEARLATPAAGRVAARGRAVPEIQVQRATESGNLTRIPVCQTVEKSAVDIAVLTVDGRGGTQRREAVPKATFLRCLVHRAVGVITVPWGHDVTGRCVPVPDGTLRGAHLRVQFGWLASVHGEDITLVGARGERQKWAAREALSGAGVEMALGVRVAAAPRLNRLASLHAR